MLKEGDARLYASHRIRRNVLFDEKMSHAALRRGFQYLGEVNRTVTKFDGRSVLCHVL